MEQLTALEYRVFSSTFLSNPIFKADRSEKLRSNVSICFRHLFSSSTVRLFGPCRFRDELLGLLPWQ